MTIAEIYEALGDYPKAAEAYGAAAAIEPSESLDARLDELRERAAFAAMPAEYKAIRGSPTVTRAQLAALFGVRLDDLLRRARRANAVVMTDTRGQLGRAVDPVCVACRPDGAVSQPYVPAERLGTTGRSRTSRLARAGAPRRRQSQAGASWRNARGRFPDSAPGTSQLPGGLAWPSNRA